MVTPHSPELPEQGSQVIASLVIGSNGATSLHGSSRGLRTSEDRTRFRALRGAPEISAILVGGATVAVEPYHSAPQPIICFSREACGEVDSIPIFIEKLKRKYPGTILCEGGVQLLHLLLKEDLIDLAFISRVSILGDGHFLDEELFQSKMALASSETINQTTFEKYERASR